MKIRRERASAASAQACPPQCSARVDCDSPAVGGQRQRNFQLPGSRLLARNNWGCLSSDPPVATTPTNHPHLGTTSTLEEAAKPVAAFPISLKRPVPLAPHHHYPHCRARHMGTDQLRPKSYPASCGKRGSRHYLAVIQKGVPILDCPDRHRVTGQPANCRPLHVTSGRLFVSVPSPLESTMRLPRLPGTVGEPLDRFSEHLPVQDRSVER